MTSVELKHRAKLQEWAARIQECRSSGLPVWAWYKERGVSKGTYYRWERELLETAGKVPRAGTAAVTFAELPPRQASRSVEECSATLRIGDVSLDVYPGCDAEQLKMLVELMRLC